MSTEFLSNYSRILIRILTLVSNHSDDYGILQELDDHRILILDFKDFDQNIGGLCGWVLVGVSIDVFFKILVSMQEGRKENLNPKKRERELYSRLKTCNILPVRPVNDVTEGRKHPWCVCISNIIEFNLIH